LALWRRWTHGPSGANVDATRGVGEADSKQFCDTIEQDGRVRRLAERSDDGARRRVMRKWLKAGVLDTGGTVTPILTHGFRHDAGDRWCAKVVTQPGRGEACLIRSADEFGCAFADHTAAKRFAHVLGQRLEQCGLERSGAKTRISPFRRHQPAGKTRVVCLGFECRW